MRPSNRRMLCPPALCLLQLIIFIVLSVLSCTLVDGQPARGEDEQIPASSCYFVQPAGLLEPNTAGTYPMRCADFLSGNIFSPNDSDPVFRLKSIWQSNPMASCADREMQKNTIVLGLWLADGNDLPGPISTIKISGLAGAVLDRLVRVSSLDSCTMQGGRLTGDKRKCFMHSQHLAARSNSWADAAASCADWGGYLASIKNSAENSLVEELVLRRPSSSYSVAWIGYSDIAEEGKWVWSDGVDSSFSNWKMGEPNNGGSWNTRMEEDCASVSERGWNDVDCNANMEYICSKRVEPQTHLFCSGSDTDVGEWDNNADGGTLSLTVCEDAVVSSETPYFFTFEISNPSNAQDSADVYIEASGSQYIPRTQMDTYGPLIDAAGIAGAADPLLILDRCSGCPAGSFWQGLEGCVRCPAGQFSEQADADACQQCPPGSTSPAGSGSVEDCECIQGYMSEPVGSERGDRDSGGRHCVFCNRSSVISGPEGTLEDGSGEGEYMDGQLCSWTIVAPHRWKLVLEFTAFNTLQGWDFVTVSACSEPACTTAKLLARLSGPLAPAGSGVRYTGIPDGGFLSTTGIFLVAFAASTLPSHLHDSPYLSGARLGFHATWHTPPPRLGALALVRIDPSLSCSESATANPFPAPPPDRYSPPSSRPPRPGPAPGSTVVGPDAAAVQVGGDCSSPTRSQSLGSPSGSSTLLIRLSLDSPVGLDGRGEIVVSGLGAAFVIGAEHPRVLVGLEGDDPCVEGGGWRVGRTSKCFQMIERGMMRTWDEAASLCGAWGGSLATVSNAEENDVLFMLMSGANAWTGAWIGYRIRGHGRFDGQWADGSESWFSNWHPSAASEAGNCSAVSRSALRDPTWHRSVCTARMEYVCSKPMPLAGAAGPKFCAGLSRERGEWDPQAGGGTLTLTLCAGELLRPDAVYHIAVNGSNPTEMDVCDDVSTSVSSHQLSIAPTAARLVEMPACMPCPPGSFNPWSAWRECARCNGTVLGASMPHPSQRLDSDLMCAACPPGSSSRPGASSAHACTCNAGFYSHGEAECRVCPAGSFCSGLPPHMPVRCPGNTTSIPGSTHPGACMCGPGYALSASAGTYMPYSLAPNTAHQDGSGRPDPSSAGPQPRPPASHHGGPATEAEMTAWAAAHNATSANASAVWCVPCPEDHFCPDRGQTAQRCPPSGFTPIGATSQAECRFCRSRTELVASSGNVSDGSVLRTHPNPTECAWIIRPPGATKVMLTIESWLSPAGSSGMQLRVDKCLDRDCVESEPLTTISGGIPASQPIESTAIESTTGIMRLVFRSSNANGDAKAGSSSSVGSAGTSSVGSFMARWLSEPSFATKTVRQTNPFASCRNNSPLLHSNTILVQLQIRASVPLSSTHSSTITISGLSGAVMPAFVPVQGEKVSDLCVDGGGMRVSGSDKCFIVLAEPTTWDGADAACRRWGGGRLACVEEASEFEMLGRVLGEKQMWSAWIGHFYDRGEGQWAWDNACPSRLSLSVPETGFARGDCAAVGARASAVTSSGMMAMDCATRLHGICSKDQPRVENAETLFCVGSQPGMGSWRPHQANGSLVLTLCDGRAIEPYAQYMLAFTITNPSSSQPSPNIRISARGSFAIGATSVDKPGRARGVSGIDDAEQPLKIVGSSGSASNVECDFASAGLLREVDTVQADDGERERYQPGGSVTLIVCGGALVVTIFGAGGYMCWHGMVAVPSASSLGSLRDMDFEALRNAFKKKSTRIRMEGSEREMEDF